MKTIQIRLKDSDGAIYKWSIKWIESAFVCGESLKNGRRVKGWEYTSHDGVQRFAEGNWRDLVPAFKLTASNYGFELCSELS